MLNTKLQKIGNSLYLNVPKKIAGFLKLQVGDRVMILSMEKEGENESRTIKRVSE